MERRRSSASICSAVTERFERAYSECACGHVLSGLSRTSKICVRCIRGLGVCTCLYFRQRRRTNIGSTQSYILCLCAELFPTCPMLMRAWVCAHGNCCLGRHQSRLAHQAACGRPRQLRRGESCSCQASLTSNLIELSIGVAIAGGLVYSAVPLVSGKAKARNAGAPQLSCASPWHLGL